MQWKIDGSRFKNREEYEAALRDKKLIDSITRNLSLDKPEDIEKLYHELKQGKVRFESIVGRQFDDNIYELYAKVQLEQIEKQEKEKQQKEKRRQDIDRLKQKVLHRNRPKQEKISLKDFDRKMQKEILSEMRKRQRKRRLLIAACSVACALCFGYLIYYYQTAAASEDEFEQLAELKETKTPTSASVVVHRTDDEETEVPDILEEYQTLYAKNCRLIGWIKIEDTVIDYPVMQTVDNEYYLTHDFYQNEDKNGCIFMDYQCDVINGCDNIILYGHHMQSGKMFGSLSKYQNESYYEEHPTIQFDTIYEKGTYQIMYVFRSKVYSEEEVTFKYYQFINAASQKEFDSAMYEMAEMSLYDTGVTASYGDQILTLSTCDYQESNGRFVVVAKKI